MRQDTVELEVRGVRPQPGDTVLPIAAVVHRRGRPADEALSIVIGAGDAHTLAHELRGEQTPRSQAVEVVSRVADALGGRLRAALLVADGPRQLTGRIEIDCASGVLTVDATPGQVLAAAVCLGVPLLADACLFQLSSNDESDAELGDSLATFLRDLDMSGLGSDAEAPEPRASEQD